MPDVGTLLANSGDVAIITQDSWAASRVGQNRQGAQDETGAAKPSDAAGSDCGSPVFEARRGSGERRTARLARWLPLSLGCAASILGTAYARTASAEVGVCVEVQEKSWSDDSPKAPAPPEKRAKQNDLSLDAASERAFAHFRGLSAKEGENPDSGQVDTRLVPETEQQATTPAAMPPPAAPQQDLQATEGPTKAALQQAESIRVVQEDNEPNPEGYLKRMLEYEVTHKPGFEAVATGCSQRIVVELYPIKGGYTVFARYTGFGREERVNSVSMEEFPQLAGRVVKALLEDRPISETVSRQDVLQADSEGKLRKVDVQGHALFALGTTFRVTKMPTAPEGDGAATRELRWLTPADIRLGYRGKFQAWGLDAFGILELGTEEMSVRQNPGGGHVDYSGSGGLGLHFLRYFSQDDMNSLYVGGGATFAVSIFQKIREPERREDKSRDTITGTGLELDGLVGYEFMRASALSFFAQADLRLPTYLVRFEHNDALTNSYMPGLMAEIGMVF